MVNSVLILYIIEYKNDKYRDLAELTAGKLAITENATCGTRRTFRFVGTLFTHG